MRVTEALKKFRQNLGLSQKDIADVLDTTPQNVYRFEKVDSAISAESIVKLATKFNVSTDYLLGRTDVPNAAANEQILKAAMQFNQVVNNAMQNALNDK